LPSKGRLHPRLEALLHAQGWTGLTGAQEAALGPLQAGKHVLLVAPTGHGKTEAALLPMLSRLLEERDILLAAKRAWPTGFKALYVTPLRALNRDLMTRLTSWAEALQLEIGVRHGDTSQGERSRQSRRPPDLLITTPETVQLLLYGDTLRRHLGTVRFVVLDEVHELASSERGAQLAVALERIEEVIAQPEALREAKANERPCPEAPPRAGPGFQRIGLSATVADPTAVARFLGGSYRDVEIVQVAAAKDIQLTVLAPQPSEADTLRGARLSMPAEAAAQLRAVRELVSAHARVLVFQNTRDAAEVLVNRSRMWDEEEGLAEEAALELHHGSLSAEHRQDVEERFKDGRIKALVATSSLELGIDVGAIDHVVQIHSPRSVARLVQRLGRAGHRVGLVSEGTLVADGPEDVLECLAVARRARAGLLEPLPIRDGPLVVLANQLIALANEYDGLRKEWALEVVMRASPFAELDEAMYDVVWETLQEVRTLYPAEEAGRVQRGGRARRHFIEHISLIPDERTYRIIDESTKRTIGTVDDAFVAAGLHLGALFIMAGRSWQVLEVQAEAQRVRVAPVKDIGAVPQWTGSQLPVSFEVAQEVAMLRGLIAQGADVTHYPADAETWAIAMEPVRRQLDAGLAVPTDRVVCIEMARRQFVLHVALGTRGNEAFGRIVQALLHQRFGAPVGLDSDAYRIHLDLPAPFSATDMQELWRSLDPDTLDLLLGLVLREAPVVRHHLVHVAKHFGALPKQLDPNRTTRARLDALLANLALHEETISRLAHERLDLPAVADFLRRLDAGEIRVIAQGVGPLARLGRDQARRTLAPARSDEVLLAEVRKRIEESDVLMVCCNCRHHWSDTVVGLPRVVRCRRCSSGQVACLRPWNQDKIYLLARDPGELQPEERLERERLIRNGALMANFGPVAARCLVARGIGPDTAARIVQKVNDIESPALWREILAAEIQFARTNVFWKRGG
jgi:ATP-dependent helicase Lhr and Lhr-like helicase